MAKWIMTIDIEKCENCNNCFLACKDEHYDNDWQPYTLAQPRHGHRWMNIHRREQGQFPCISVAYMPRPCFHCPDPPCMSGCSKGEIYKRPDGIVVVDPEKSRGRKDLAAACPHGAIWWNEENQTPQKCTFCAHLLDNGWQQPRCVQACPTGALTFQKIPHESLGEYMRSQGLVTADGSVPPSGSRVPGILYKNLDLYNKFFIAGSVATGKGAVEECVEGVRVELLQKENLVARQTTDAFGDFRFPGLSRNSSPFELRLHFRGNEVGREKVALTTSTFIGTLWI
ncbi:MAG: oxidoreductase [Desulfobacter sp.]|nr:MAG: oxidoreductase [Desulfobacter sp.]